MPCPMHTLYGMAHTGPRAEPSSPNESDHTLELMHAPDPSSLSYRREDPPAIHVPILRRLSATGIAVGLRRAFVLMTACHACRTVRVELRGAADASAS